MDWITQAWPQIGAWAIVVAGGFWIVRSNTKEITRLNGLLEASYDRERQMLVKQFEVNSAMSKTNDAFLAAFKGSQK